MMIINRRAWGREIKLVSEFLLLETELMARIGEIFLGWLLIVKETVTKLMYRQRGRFSQSFINISMAVMSFVAIVFSGKLEEMIRNSRSGEGMGSNYLILAASDSSDANTLISDLPKGEVREYRVQEGDTVASIALKFGVNIDTIVWENNLKSADAIKPKQILKILPVVGVKHVVKRGETVYSIAKRYQVDAQNIIDYPFNTYTDDETYALAAGQEVIVPEGVKPNEVVVDTARYATRTVAPIPGVVGEGNFMWPTSGKISQKYYWYHPAIDIASRESPAILASQGGTVISAGWNGGGYGNFVVIDHGNGFQTLYAHMMNNSMTVKAGDKVAQGQKLGVMGSTGRSTGPHLHFEIRVNNNKGKVDPLTKLR